LFILLFLGCNKRQRRQFASPEIAYRIQAQICKARFVRSYRFHDWIRIKSSSTFPQPTSAKSEIRVRRWTKDGRASQAKTVRQNNSENNHDSRPIGRIFHRFRKRVQIEKRNLQTRQCVESRIRWQRSSQSDSGKKLRDSSADRKW